MWIFPFTCMTGECWAAFSERCTHLFSHLPGNNTGVCSLTVRYTSVYCLTGRLMQFTWCLRTLCSQAWKACLVLSLLSLITLICNEWHTHHTIRCYFVCTHNRIRSPRLAAFGRIETRWVREVGKFGPYLRYKDWLRRRLLELYMYLICYYISN